MRFLADENFPKAAVDAIRELGHEVRWVREESPGSPDLFVLGQSASDESILLTFDKDFGDLIFKGRASAPPGIILCRFPPRSSTYIASVIVGALESRNDWHGNFSVIEEDKIRMTALPDSSI